MPGQEVHAHLLLSRREVMKGIAALALVLSETGCVGSASPPPSSASTLAQAPGKPVYTYHGHSARVTSIAWSYDGGRIASASLDKTVQVWNATNGTHAFIYRGHTDGVTSVAWSPHENFIASGSEDKTVQVWAAATGNVRVVCRGHADQVTSVVWSPDSARIASGSLDATVRVWDAVSGENRLRYSGHSDQVDTVAWSPRGTYIASGSHDRTIQVWEAVSGAHVYMYHGHTDVVTSLAWSPDGRYIASGSRDKTVQVWEAVTGHLLYTYHGYNVEIARTDNSKGVLPDIIFDVAWSHNGKRLAALTQEYCGDICGVVLLWDALTGRNISFYADLPIFTLAWSPDDTRLVTSLSTSLVEIARA